MIFTILFALVHFNLAQASVPETLVAPPKTSAQYWKDTGLTFQNFLEDIPKRCYDSVRSFAGCLNGLSELSLRSSQGKTLLAAITEKSGGNTELGQKIKDLGNGLALYQVSMNPKATQIELLDLLKKQHALRSQTARKFFVSNQRIHFKSLFTLLSQGVTDAEEAETAGALYTTFLQATVDPHARLEPTQKITDQMTQPGETYYGIGIFIHYANSHFAINKIFEGSPAQKAGLKRNDVFLSIDGHSVENITDATVVTKLLRGSEKGSTIHLTLLRQGVKVNIDVTRDSVTLENVDYRLVQDSGIPVGYISLKSFEDAEAASKVAIATVLLQQAGAQALILDFRDNPGGSINQAIGISNAFVGKKKLLSVKELTTGNETTFVGANDSLLSVPMAVIINGDSASASEIVAGALQDNQTALIVGDRSFGKGSVQAPFAFPFDSYKGDIGKIVFYKTIERFYQPSGRTNQIQGIIPNVYVDAKPNATELDRVTEREEDVYPDALPVIKNEWLEPRPALIEALNQCRAKNMPGIEAKYRAQDASIEELSPPDYRLMVTEELLRCQLTLQK